MDPSDNPQNPSNNPSGNPPNPSDYCHWVLPPSLDCGGLLIGGYPYPEKEYLDTHLNRLLSVGIRVWVNLTEEEEIEKFGDYRPYVIARSVRKPEFISLPTPDRGVGRDQDLYDTIEKVHSFIRKGKTVYVHCWGGHGRSGVFAACFLMRWYGYDSEKALQINRELHSTRKHHPNKPTPQGVRQYSQIRRYKPPITVIVTGDRDSFNSYRNIIRKELSDLPPGSTVVHGDCRGIDKLSGEIAQELGLNVLEFPVTKEEWETFGKAAGPIRNKRMLKTQPKYVLAFHPDIQYSRGTRDMMSIAYLAGVTVYLFDLKDRKLFEGDFSEM